MSQPPDSVTRWAPLAQKYGSQFGVPSNVLLGLIQVESGGRTGLTSPKGAQGLTQFVPGTARQYNVKIGDPASEVRGAAQYLHDLGFSKDPTQALARYNGGTKPPAESFGYAKNVLGAASAYKGPGAGPSYTPQASPATASALPAPSGTSGLSDLLTRPAGLVSAPAAPAFSARAVTPAGYTPPPGVSASIRPDLSSMLSSPPPVDLPAAQTAPVPSFSTDANPSPGAGGLSQTNSSFKIRDVFSRAAAIDAEHLPYKWGGGHGPTPAKPGVPLDCSGAVSRLFGVAPRVSGQFETFGNAGRGKQVTIYANGKHVLVEIAGRFWGTSAANPNGGAGWIPRGAISQSYLQNFTARHPAGL